MALSPLVSASVLETEIEKVVDKVPTLFEREDTFATPDPFRRKYTKIMDSLYL